MSLDTLLSDGLRVAAEGLEPDVEMRLAEARRLHGRRQSNRRTVLLAAALVGALLVAVPVGRHLVGRDEPAPAGPVTDAQARSLLTDTWVTPSVDRARVAAVLSAAGLGEHLDTIALDQRLPDAWNLALRRHRYALGAARGGPRDSGTWRVHGDALVLRPDECGCSAVFRWTVRHDRLSLTLLSDDGPEIDGAPDKAYALAYYTTAPFSRFVASTP